MSIRFVLAVLVCILLPCRADSAVGTPLTVSPVAGPPGITLQITGAGFDPAGMGKPHAWIENPATKWKFNLKVVSWSDDHVDGILKTGKLHPQGFDTYNVVVAPTGKDSPLMTEFGVFTIRGPSLDGPLQITTGTNGSITGKFFGPKPGKIRIGKSTMKIIDWEYETLSGLSSVTIQVPKKNILAGSNDLTIKTSMGKVVFPGAVNVIIEPGTHVVIDADILGQVGARIRGFPNADQMDAGWVSGSTALEVSGGGTYTSSSGGVGIIVSGGSGEESGGVAIHASGGTSDQGVSGTGLVAIGGSNQLGASGSGVFARGGSGFQPGDGIVAVVGDGDLHAAAVRAIGDIVCVGRLVIGNDPPVPQFDLHVVGTAGKPGGGEWSVASDRRLKRDIQPLEGALDTMLRLKGVTFEWINSDRVSELPGRQMGMVAQDVEKVFPEWIGEGADGFKRLTVRGFSALTVEALRQLRREKDAEIASLRTRVATLEALVANLGISETHQPAGSACGDAPLMGRASERSLRPAENRIVAEQQPALESVSKDQ